MAGAESKGGGGLKLPVIYKTAWINKGNRPEKVTAKGVRLPQSRQASIGGKGIHMDAPGIKAVMTAPRAHRAPAVVVPVRRKAKGSPPTPKPTVCPTCGDLFRSKKAWGKHQHEQHHWPQAATKAGKS